MVVSTYKNAFQGSIFTKMTVRSYPKTVLAVISLAAILSVLLSACGAPTTPIAAIDAGVFYTQAAATIVLGLTETSQAAPSSTPAPSPTTPPSATASLLPAPGATPETPAPPTSLPSPTALHIDPATAFGCYNAALVADVTLRYAENFKPGEHFTKTWRIQNTGNCDWPRGFKIAFANGNRFGTDTITINQKVLAGSQADISLDMIAPDLNGLVTSTWQLTTNTGKSFGPLLSVAINLPSANPSPSAEAAGCLNSALVKDVSIPTGTEIQAGSAFTKTWLIKNTGTCTWNRDFRITFVAGSLLGSDTTRIRKLVEPGASAEISLQMTAPQTSGTVSTAWQMSSDSGQLFGQLFAFVIVVK